MDIEEECKKAVDGIMMGEVFDENGQVVANAGDCAIAMSKSFIDRCATTFNNLSDETERKIFTIIITNFLSITINCIYSKSSKQDIETFRDFVFKPLLDKFQDGDSKVEYLSRTDVSL